MRFDVRGDLLVFSDDRPGQHATMFEPLGRKLKFRADASSFDDAAQRYEWAFELADPLRDGDRFIFATVDREVVGVVVDATDAALGGSRVQVLDRVKVTVARESDGKPVEARVRE